MKRILVALTVIVTMHVGAFAQSKYDKNYRVCKTGANYKVCEPGDPLITPSNSAADNKQHVEKSLRTLDTHVKVGDDNTVATMSYKRNPRIVVFYEDPNGMYEGKDTKANDGVHKNKVRNVNYLDNSVDLPANDGSVAGRR